MTESDEISDEQKKENETDLARLKSAVAKLMEYFDTVQISVTKVRNGGQMHASCNWGDGNWFARYGALRQWVVEQDEGFRDRMRDKPD